MALELLTNIFPIKIQGISLRVTLIRNLNEFEDLIYLTVNIFTKTSAISHKLKSLKLFRISKL